MPILAPETEIYPVNLLADAGFDAAGREWWGLHTRPRHEKSLARQLFTQRVPFFLPLIPRHNEVRGRVLISHIPLFGGYVFLLANPQERLLALGTRRVVLSLKVPDPEGLWCDLRQIRRLIEAGAVLTPEERLPRGEPVEIR